MVYNNSVLGRDFMKIFKDKKVVVLAVVIFIFTVIYFVAVNKISYAFETENTDRDSYNSLITTIKKCAKVYAEKHTDLFKDEMTIYIKVQDLIDADLLAPNDGTNVISPLDKSSIINSNIIKIKKEDNNYYVEVDN